MVRAGTFWREQQEHQVDRLAIERLEVDRTLEPREQAEQLLEVGQLAVRDRDAIAHASRAELLALHQGFEYQPLVQPGELRGTPRELLDRLLLAIHLERRDHG